MIPPETKGKNVNLEQSMDAGTKEAATAAYQKACERMLNPAVWHKLCGPASAKFVLTTDTGDETRGAAKKGDYFKIDIPGPGSSEGDGYDWVTVEFIEEINNPGHDEDLYGMKLRASSNPSKEGAETAHFFTDEATSSFIIHRKGIKVTASYHGRNEVPNISTGKATDNVRNSLVALGAFAQLSEVQWTALIKGFLENEATGS